MRIWSVVFAVILAMATGCTFQGIPAHGGGKRFDEEQNIVSKSVIDTVKQIDVSILEGKRVRFFILGIGDQGAVPFDEFRAMLRKEIEDRALPPVPESVG